MSLLTDPIFKNSHFLADQTSKLFNTKFGLQRKDQKSVYSLMPNRRGVGIVGGWKNDQNVISRVETSPKFNKLFLFLSKIYLFSSIQYEYFSWKLVLDEIFPKI